MAVDIIRGVNDTASILETTEEMLRRTGHYIDELRASDDPRAVALAQRITEEIMHLCHVVASIMQFPANIGLRAQHANACRVLTDLAGEAFDLMDALEDEA
jgi:hypothetical protein